MRVNFQNGILACKDLPFLWHSTDLVLSYYFGSFQISQSRSMQKIKAWTDHIIRHFWYCSSSCKENDTTSDEEALRIMKVTFVTWHTTTCNYLLFSQNKHPLQGHPYCRHYPKHLMIGNGIKDMQKNYCVVI